MSDEPEQRHAGGMEVPERDRQEQELPPPTVDRDLEERSLEAAEADELDQSTSVRGADDLQDIRPGDETDGGI